MSASELASQLAFNTQIPYNNKIQDHGSPLYNSRTPQSKPQVLRDITDERSGQIRDGQQDGNLHAHLAIDDPQPEQRRSPPRSLKKPTLVGHRHTVEDEDLSSSDESVECQRYVAPDSGASPTSTRAPDQQNPCDTDAAQPFPLVEWIKQIRKDTFKPWPMLPIRWARTISKKQQAILDQDDAWLPPLAGRPLRPGSIPIDILQRLTDRADHPTTNSLATSIETAREEHARDSIQGSLPSPQMSRQDDASRSSVIGQTDRESDEGTDEFVPWSSSPPRPRMPPDSSPVTKASQLKTNGNPQTDVVRLDLIDEADSTLHIHQLENEQHDGHLPLTTNQAEERQDLANESSQLVQDEDQQNPIREDTQGCIASEPTPSLVTQLAQQSATHSTPAIDTSTRLPPQSQPELQTEGTKLIAKVQVKDTPYVPKEAQKIPQSTVLPYNAPPSSFVGATYPDLPSARSRRVFFRNEPGETGSVVSTSAVDESKSHPALRPLTRIMHTNNGENYTQNEIQTPPEDEDVTAARSTLETDANPEPVAGSTISDHDVAPPAKRQKLKQKPTRHRKSNEQVSVYQQFDKQRMLERRRFFTTRSVTCTNAGPDNTDALLRHNRRAQPKTASRASSPHTSARHTNVSCSEIGSTSATNLSIHKSYTPRTPAQKLSLRGSSININLESEHFGLGFSTFKNAYPEYRGNQKAFRSALLLLLRLQSQRREPHPSLWDDFIFRMAHDYKQYLGECMENSDSAVEYQDYYHTRVKRSERTKEIITEDVLQAFDEDVSLDGMDVRDSRPQQSRSVGRLRISNDVEMRDVPRPKSALVFETRDARRPESSKPTNQPEPSAGKKRKGQEKDQCEIPETQAMPAEPAALRSRHSLPSQPTRGRPATETVKSAIKKRRSLPWDASKSKSDATPSSIPLQGIANTSQSQNSTSSKVEKWLLTSRAAGAASPELEAMELPTPELNIHASALVGNRDVPPLCLKRNASAIAQEIVQSIESPANGPLRRLRVTHQPDTQFASFASNYAKLQSEKPFQLLSAEKRRVPINIYDW